MSLDEPEWWYPEPHLRPRKVPPLLGPVSRIVAFAARRRLSGSPGYVSRLPVICVGNLTVGGTGKTPMTRYIAELLTRSGERPVILSRGFGGSLEGPVAVDMARHKASEVGDEPLLLARYAPVVISRDRRQGARFIERLEPAPTVILMDDGLQNPGLAQDLAIALVDAKRGLGNGRVLPAGPLRAEVADQAGRIGVIVVSGEKDAAHVTPGLDMLRHEAPHATMLSSRVVKVGDTHWLYDEPVVAYAGIAHPRRFFALLKRLHAKVLAEVVFPDHKPFSPRDAERLLTRAKGLNARLVTTEKDIARLSNTTGVLSELAAASRTLPVALTLPDFDAARLSTLLRDTIAHVRSLDR